MGGFGSVIGKAAGAIAEAAGTVAEGAETAGGLMADAAGTAADGAKVFFSQTWDNAKQDVANYGKQFVAKDEAGNVDGWGTAGNVGYHAAKKALLSSGGGVESTEGPLPDMSQPARATATEAPNAEDELTRLRNRMNG